MARRSIPERAEGWKFAGAAGDFHVWHAGKNDYRISDGATGDVVASSDQFGLAHVIARRRNDERCSEHITEYYKDRANGAHAARAP